MPRYYFNVYDGENVIDKEGIEFESKREMRIHMVTYAARLFEDNAALKAGTWHMEAVDESGRIVGSIDFKPFSKEE